MRLNSVSYSLIGNSWPSQNIHPAGAKFPANMRISPTYGCAIFSFLLVRRREDALQRDTDTQRQERLHIQVRLAPAGVRERCRVQCNEVGRRRVVVVDRIRAVGGPAV